MFDLSFSVSLDVWGVLAIVAAVFAYLELRPKRESEFPTGVWVATE